MPRSEQGPRQRFEPDMVHVPAGEFLMGSDPRKDERAQSDEEPQHTLYLPDYSISRTPVTHLQYRAYVSAGHRQPVNWENGKPLTEGRDNYPVIYVSWHDAARYCRWLSEVTGKPYRLPSEAEWEKGARGTDGRIYPWGDAREDGRSIPYPGGSRPLAPVGAYPQNQSPYGLLDMVGNVMEWTRSLYVGYPYDPTDGREDLSARGDRVVRGGSYYALVYGGRCAVRHVCHYRWNYNLGFRVVQAPGQPADRKACAGQEL